MRTDILDATGPRAARGAVVLAAVLSLMSARTDAAELRVPPEMMSRLPSYCANTIGFVNDLSHIYGGSKESMAEWKRKIGPGFEALHHHCWGLADMIMAGQSASDKTKVRFLFNRAAREFTFVLSHVPQDFVLLPEILSKQGTAYVRLGEHGKAETNFRQVMELKADYWPAYTGLAESFIEQKRTADARQILKDGLTKASDRRVLERMLRELESGK